MTVRREKRRDPKTGTVREFYMVDVDVQLPDGRRTRKRKVAPIQTKRDAERYERELRASILDGTFEKKEVGQVPTLADFADQYVGEFCPSQKHKPSTIAGRRSSLENHLLELFGDRRLDSFGPRDEVRLKSHLVNHAASSYNNAASTMNGVLKAAQTIGIIERVPHKFAFVKRDVQPPAFYDFEQYESLVEATCEECPEALATGLLGGDGGLRRGEIIALEWTNVHFGQSKIVVAQSEWKGQVTPTKGMRFRSVPMTKRLRAALHAIRHLRGPRVLYGSDGQPVTASDLQNWMLRAQDKAGLVATGGLHILRHTFCSHLAMRGAPARTIQELAGHESLSTTLRYMHLAEGETDRAIRLLEAGHAPKRQHSGKRQEGEAITCWNPDGKMTAVAGYQTRPMQIEAERAGLLC